MLVSVDNWTGMDEVFWLLCVQCVRGTYVDEGAACFVWCSPSVVLGQLLHGRAVPGHHQLLAHAHQHAHLPPKQARRL